MSASAVTKIPKVPPSSFSVLLRRSKFATYDPQIGQLYTTYDGSARRGDWGLKRPLAIRRRDARLIIHSVDTLYQQTEWTSAYSDSNAVRKFEEMRVTPIASSNGSWDRGFNPSSTADQPGGEVDDAYYTYSNRRIKWMRDSDYVEVPAEETQKNLELSGPLPEVRMMGPKRFERYLRRLRRLGPEFREIIEKQEQGLQARTNGRTRPVHVLGKTVADLSPQRFLGDKLLEACRGEDSTVLRPFPHPIGGLTYVNANELQTALEAKAIPGRRLEYMKDFNPNATRRTASVVLGGWLATELVSKKTGKNSASWASVTDMGTSQGEPRRDIDAGKDMFRPIRCELVNLPTVVGKRPQRLDRTALKLGVGNWYGASQSRENPYKPGSASYIGYVKPDAPTTKKEKKSSLSSSLTDFSPSYGMLRNKARPPIDLNKREQRQPANATVIARLTNMLHKKGGKDGKGS